jgi:hypothetical protein
MASLAVGSFSGVKKDAQLITAQINFGSKATITVSAALGSMLDILLHAKANNFLGRSVVSMAFGKFILSIEYKVERLVCV